MNDKQFYDVCVFYNLNGIYYEGGYKESIKMIWFEYYIQKKSKDMFEETKLRMDRINIKLCGELK